MKTHRVSLNSRLESHKEEEEAPSGTTALCPVSKAETQKPKPETRNQKTGNQKP
jgi:hypothetical protein